MKNKLSSNDVFRRMAAMVCVLALTMIAPVSEAWAMQIFVKRILTDKTITLEVEPTDSHEAIRAMIEEKLGIAPENQWLVYGDKKLEDGKTLSDDNMPAESTIKLYETSATNGFCGVETVNGGANVAWTLTGTSSNRTLTISGIGAMANFNNIGDQPWYSSRNSIRSVVIEDGVTHLGDHAFQFYTNKLKNVTIPSCVTSIGESAFANNSNLSTVNVLRSESVPTLGTDAFKSCNNSLKICVPSKVDEYKSSWSAYAVNDNAKVYQQIIQ